MDTASSVLAWFDYQPTYPPMPIDDGPSFTYGLIALGIVLVLAAVDALRRLVFLVRAERVGGKRPKERVAEAKLAAAVMLVLAAVWIAMFMFKAAFNLS
ncbi:hypothetical protein GS538_09065 [Rhodococcus hoagii]|nr:hypothetical protein [Prescottella equi]